MPKTLHLTGRGTARDVFRLADYAGRRPAITHTKAPTDTAAPSDEPAEAPRYPWGLYVNASGQFVLMGYDGEPFGTITRPPHVDEDVLGEALSHLMNVIRRTSVLTIA